MDDPKSVLDTFLNISHTFTHIVLKTWVQYMSIDIHYSVHTTVDFMLVWRYFLHFPLLLLILTNFSLSSVTQLFWLNQQGFPKDSNKAFPSDLKIVHLYCRTSHSVISSLLHSNVPRKSPISFLFSNYFSIHIISYPSILNCISNPIKRFYK